MNPLTTQSRSQFQLRASTATGMGYVVPYGWNDRSDTVVTEERTGMGYLVSCGWNDPMKVEDTGTELDGGEGNFSFSLVDSEFNFSSKHLIAEQGSFSHNRMSSADELFHEGKIRPLQPITTQSPAVSIYEEPPVVAARLQMLDDLGEGYGFDELRVSNCVRVSEPVSPFTPISNHIFNTASEPAPPASPKKYVAVGKESNSQGEDRVEQTDQSTGFLKYSIAPEPTSTVFYRRSQSLSPLRKVFHMDDEVSNVEVGRESEEESTADAKSWSLLAGGQQPVAEKRSGKSGRKKLKDLLLLKDDSRKEPAATEQPQHHHQQRRWGSFKGVVTGEGEEEEVGKLKIGPSQLWRSSDPHPATLERAAKWASARASPHERHYTAQRAEAERMKKKTFLPYRQGLLACLGFRSASLQRSAGHSSLHNPIVY